MNKSKFRAVLTLNGYTQGDLAEILGISEQRLSAKINSKSGAEFTQGEIAKFKKEFNISPGEIDEIFFDDLVSN